MEVRPIVSEGLLQSTILSRSPNNPSLIPLMGFCYMLQYMDKLALSQATLFNLAEDLVCTLLSRYFTMRLITSN